jgi:sulfite exporter TauE/SafE
MCVVGPILVTLTVGTATGAAVRWQEDQPTMPWLGISAAALLIWMALTVAVAAAVLQLARRGARTLSTQVRGVLQAAVVVVLWPILAWVALGRWMFGRLHAGAPHAGSHGRLLPRADEHPPVLLTN